MNRPDSMRYLVPYILQDLNSKMVFLGGPRQVGKTTLGLSLLEGSEEHPAYFNWDSIKQRNLLLKEILPADEPLILLDEIHKYRHWRNLVKGLYDTLKSKYKFLVTGSARLDFYRKGGDSLQGRYHFLRLHPFSYPEIQSMENPKLTMATLLKFGGFPEPLFRQSNSGWRRWQNERRARVLQEDVNSVEQVKDITQLDLLMGVLPEKVGSPLSLNNLANDLSVSHPTIERWITIFENIYVCFRIPPLGSKNLQTMKKEKKLYLWDWSLCENHGARFENLVASHLLKYCHFIEDTEGHRMELRFLRDKEKREIDLIVIQNKKILFAVECKTGEGSLSKNIVYFSQREPIPKFYQVHLGTRDYEQPKYRARVLPFAKFCEVVGLV